MIVDINKYNLIRSALVDNQDEEHDVIEVRPKTFGLKKVHAEDVLEAAKEILLDKRVATGITPYDTMKTFGDISPEIAMYVLVSYAVAVQQGWIVQSQIMNKYYVNHTNQDARQFVEDTHKLFLV